MLASDSWRAVFAKVKEILDPTRILDTQTSHRHRSPTLNLRLACGCAYIITARANDRWDFHHTSTHTRLTAHSTGMHSTDTMLKCVSKYNCQTKGET